MQCLMRQFNSVRENPSAPKGNFAICILASKPFCGVIELEARNVPI